MTFVRPRLNDYYGLPFTQEEVDFAIPFLDDDIPLYVDPFLLWKSPSQQDNGLHLGVISSINYFGRLSREGKLAEAVAALVNISECREVGLGSAANKAGHRIGKETAEEILSLFQSIPQIIQGGLAHVEEIQLFVDQISRDRISDITCSLVKSHLIDYTIDQCQRWDIPSSPTRIELFDHRSQKFITETISLPANPLTAVPILLVPKRWLRYVPWINFDDYFKTSFAKVDPSACSENRIAILNYNRHNFDQVQTYIQQKERTAADCKNDPLFKPIPITYAKRKISQIRNLPTGTTDKADKLYEDYGAQLMASLLYPHLDFADDQSRTDSGVLIRDLIFYNNRSFDFLADIYQDYGCRQIVMELKNVAKVEREHVNQLNRYLNDQFGRFGILLTRKPLPDNIFRNTVDLWAGQRRCIIALTDQDLDTMVTVFESKSRLPIEVIKRAYINFTRACPS
jgi:hypothetical protein